MEGAGVAVMVILLIAFAIVMSCMRREQHSDEATRMAEARGLKVISAEITMWDRGPYWIKGKGTHIIRLTCEDREGNSQILYYRSGTLFRDAELRETEG